MAGNKTKVAILSTFLAIALLLVASLIILPLFSFFGPPVTSNGFPLAYRYSYFVQGRLTSETVTLLALIDFLFWYLVSFVLLLSIYKIRSSRRNVSKSPQTLRK